MDESLISDTNNSDGLQALSPQLPYSIILHEVGCRQYFEEDEEWLIGDCQVRLYCIFV